MTAADIIEQWQEMVAEIVQIEGYMTIKFHELWAHVLLSYSDEYPLVLRLVVITLLVPADTSECERVFSLMNDLKTAERNRLNQKYLKNLMLWHTMAKELKCEEVPVMAILQVFRELAGERGRQAHRPCAQPTRPNTRTASRRT